jgi:hypothetical protein
VIRREFLKLLGLVTATAVIPWPIRRLTSHIATKVAHPGDRITIVIHSGRSSRAVTWDPAFKLAGPISPSGSRQRSVTFLRDNSGNWYEESRTL